MASFPRMLTSDLYLTSTSAILLSSPPGFTLGLDPCPVGFILNSEHMSGAIDGTSCFRLFTAYGTLDSLMRNLLVLHFCFFFLQGVHDHFRPYRTFLHLHAKNVKSGAQLFRRGVVPSTPSCRSATRHKHNRCLWLQ